MDRGRRGCDVRWLLAALLKQLASRIIRVTAVIVAIVVVVEDDDGQALVQILAKPSSSCFKGTFVPLLLLPCANKSLPTLCSMAS